MTMDNDRDRNGVKTRPGDNNRTWVLGALAILALVSVLFWTFSGGRTNVANNTGDPNTGSVTAPAPAGPAAGTAPARP